jgi:hypothetical protein
MLPYNMLHVPCYKLSSIHLNAFSWLQHEGLGRFYIFSSLMTISTKELTDNLSVLLVSCNADILIMSHCYVCCNVFIPFGNLWTGCQVRTCMSLNDHLELAVFASSATNRFHLDSLHYLAEWVCCVVNINISLFWSWNILVGKVTGYSLDD